MKNAANEGKLRRFQEERGIQIPLLENKPELFPHLSWVWEFFNKLSTTRQSSWNGPQPLTFQDIQTLASLERICYYEDIEELIFFIPRLDSVYLKYQKDKQAVSTPKPKGGSK